MLSEVTGITDVFAHQERWIWEKTPKQLVPDEIHYVNYLDLKINKIKIRVSEYHWMKDSLIWLLNTTQNGG